MPDDAKPDDVQQDGSADTPVIPAVEQQVGSPSAAEVGAENMNTQIQNLGDELHKAERWMIWLTGAIAFFGLCTVVVGFLQWNAMKGQLSEMHSGGIDTHTLAETAKRQVDKTETISNSITQAVADLKETADAAMVQAGASKTFAKATETSAHIAQAAMQPIIGVRIFMGQITDTSITFDIRIRNEGGSAAIVNARYCSFDDPRANNWSVDQCGATATTSGPLTVLPHNDFPIAVYLPDGMGNFIKGKAYLFFPIELRYSVMGIERTEQHCFVYEATLKGMRECTDLRGQNKKPN